MQTSNTLKPQGCLNYGLRARSQVDYATLAYGNQPTSSGQKIVRLEPQAGRVLLPPLQSASILPRFVCCQYMFRHRQTYLSHWLENPLQSAAPGTKIDVEISLSVHSADWDMNAYIISHTPQHTLTAQPANSSGQQHAGAAGQQQSVPGAAASSGNAQGSNSDPAAKTYGPFIVKANLRIVSGKTTNHIALDALPVAGILANYVSGVHTHDVVLQQQVGPAAFILHLKPAQAAAGSQTRAPSVTQTVSVAGEGPGLQVFPGSFPDVECDVSVGCNMSNGKPCYVRFTVPKALVVSQLHDTPLPTALKWVIKDLQHGLQGAQINPTSQLSPLLLYMTTFNESSRYYIQVKLCHPISAYKDRRIIRMALTPDKQLTLYLAPQDPEQASGPSSSIGPAAAAAAAPAAAAGGPAPGSTPPADEQAAHPGFAPARRKRSRTTAASDSAEAAADDTPKGGPNKRPRATTAAAVQTQGEAGLPTSGCTAVGLKRPHAALVGNLAAAIGSTAAAAPYTPTTRVLPAWLATAAAGGDTAATAGAAAGGATWAPADDHAAAAGATATGKMVPSVSGNMTATAGGDAATKLGNVATSADGNATATVMRPSAGAAAAVNTQATAGVDATPAAVGGKAAADGSTSSKTAAGGNPALIEHLLQKPSTAPNTTLAPAGSPAATTAAATNAAAAAGGGGPGTSVAAVAGSPDEPAAADQGVPSQSAEANVTTAGTSVLVKLEIANAVAHNPAVKVRAVHMPSTAPKQAPAAGTAPATAPAAAAWLQPPPTAADAAGLGVINHTAAGVAKVEGTDAVADHTAAMVCSSTAALHSPASDPVQAPAAAAAAAATAAAAAATTASAPAFTHVPMSAAAAEAAAGTPQRPATAAADTSNAAATRPAAAAAAAAADECVIDLTGDDDDPVEVKAEEDTQAAAGNTLAAAAAGNEAAAAGTAVKIEGGVQEHRNWKGSGNVLAASAAAAGAADTTAPLPVPQSVTIAAAAAAGAIGAAEPGSALGEGTGAAPRDLAAAAAVVVKDEGRVQGDRAQVSGVQPAVLVAAAGDAGHATRLPMTAAADVDPVAAGSASGAAGGVADAGALVPVGTAVGVLEGVAEQHNQAAAQSGGRPAAAASAVHFSNVDQQQQQQQAVDGAAEHHMQAAANTGGGAVGGVDAVNPSIVQQEQQQQQQEQAVEGAVEQHNQAAAAQPGGEVVAAAGAVSPSSVQQHQQQQRITEYLSHEILVRATCASNQDMLSNLNGMRGIALACMAAPQQQQQQQQQQADRQQLVLQYLQAEAIVMAHCAGNNTAVAALNSMSSMALGALTQDG